MGADPSRRRRPPPAAEDVEALALWVAEHLRARRISARTLARLTGLHYSTITRLIRGERAPSWATVRRLAEALHDEPPIAALGDVVASFQPESVSQALASDPVLTSEDRRQVMRYYIAIRHARSVQ